MNIHEAVIELRKEYCEGCQEQFSDEEIEEGAMCDFCEKVRETGKQVAHLRD